MSPTHMHAIITTPYTRPQSVGGETTTIRDLFVGCIRKCDEIGAMPQLRQIFKNPEEWKKVIAVRLGHSLYVYLISSTGHTGDGSQEHFQT